jgi:hypothetical protein
LDVGSGCITTGSTNVALNVFDFFEGFFDVRRGGCQMCPHVDQAVDSAAKYSTGYGSEKWLVRGVHQSAHFDDKNPTVIGFLPFTVLSPKDH